MRKTLAALAVPTVLLALGAVPAHADGLPSAGVRWDLDGTKTLLAQLPGSTKAQPQALNDANTAVGFAWLGDVTHAVRWDAAGHATDLGVLPGDVYSQATAINNAGVAIGYSRGESYLERHAVRWNADGTAVRLADLPGDGSVARAINSHGTVVGWSGGKAVKWAPDGTVTALAVPAGTEDSSADAVADSGWVTGFAFEQDGLRHIVRWNAAGGMTELGAPASYDNRPVAVAEDGSVAANSAEYVDGIPIDAWADRWDPSAHHLTKLPRPSGGYMGYAVTMNDSHVVVGYLAQATEIPARWNANGTLTPLPNRGANGQATAINNAGLIAGTSNGHAVRWSATGTLTDLGVPSGYTQSSATAVNTGGSVVGYGYSY